MTLALVAPVKATSNTYFGKGEIRCKKRGLTCILLKNSGAVYLQTLSDGREKTKCWRLQHLQNALKQWDEVIA
jgi:hypothetical protein